MSGCARLRELSGAVSATAGVHTCWKTARGKLALPEVEKSPCTWPDTV